MSYRDVFFMALVGALVVGTLIVLAPDQPEVATLEETLGGEVRISGL